MLEKINLHDSKDKHQFPIARILLALALVCRISAFAKAGDWPTFGHDPQRTGWARNEDTLSARNVAGLTLLWKAHLKNTPLSLTALTAPLVASHIMTAHGAQTVVYVGGSSGTVFALNAANGQVLWSKSLAGSNVPRYPGMWLCPENLNATPTIDERAGLIYVLSPDGRLFGLGLGTGSVKFGPIQFVPPYSKNWSLNLVHGVVYTTISQGCADAQSGIYSMDVRHPMRPVIRDLLFEVGFGAGVWGRGGAVAGEGSRLYAGTGDGPMNPARGLYGSSVVAASLSRLRVEDYYSPNNAHTLTKYDLDIGASTPAWFAHGAYHLIAAGGKGGTLYLLNADDLGSADHRTPLETLRVSNDERAYEENGIWGGFATWRDIKGETWLYVPVWGPISKDAPKFPLSHGLASDGSIMAFTVAMNPRTHHPMLEPRWISRDFNRPEPPAIANGVVFALSTGENAQQTLGSAVISKPGHFGTRILTNQERMEDTRHAILFALDARTGKTLFSSGDSMTTWVHFSGLAIADGHVYAVDHDSNLYCFGLKDKGN